MLSQCANPDCAKPFLRLREGKLFLVETERLTDMAVTVPLRRTRKLPRQVEHYWLCDDCAAEWTLVCNRNQGVELAALRRTTASAPAPARSEVP